MLKQINTPLDSLEIFKRLKNDRNPMLLESQKDKEKLGRYSFMASNPFLTIEVKDGKIFIEKGIEKKEIVSNPLKVLEELMNEYKIENTTELPFIGGAIGYLGYDIGRYIEKLPNTVIDDVKIPDMFFGFYDEVIIIDNLKNEKYISILELSPNKESKEERLEKLEKKINKEIITEKKIRKEIDVDIRCNMTKDYYLNSIKEVRNYIESGDIYQINFTQRFDGNLNKTPLQLYERLKEKNPAPFASYLDFGYGKIVSSSPERFISLKKGRLEARPIKGTIARGKTKIEDDKNRKALMNSDKDKSELLMIVDLERNDLGRISEKGSVKVPELFHIEEYATVFQQVATIESKLRKDIGLKKLLEATFPGGSITGAPKIRAMEVIDELETTSRNIYTGSIGYIGFDGELDLNIVIRTIVCKDEKAYFQVGGGIVWDSTPEGEYEESLLKGVALKEALLWKGIDEL